MTPALKAELDTLEAEFATLDAAEKKYRETHESLSAQLAPIAEKIRDNEAAFDDAKARHRELAEKIDHLRKAVGA